MSRSRLLSPALRSGLMVALGTLMVIGPVVIGLSTAAASAGLLVGVLAIALGLAGSEAAFFALMGLIAGVLTARTRYTLRPSQNFL